jgi:hypothetical protein
MLLLVDDSHPRLKLLQILCTNQYFKQESGESPIDIAALICFNLGSIRGGLYNA